MTNMCRNDIVRKKVHNLKTIEGVVRTKERPFCSRPLAILSISITGFFLRKTRLKNVCKRIFMKG